MNAEPPVTDYRGEHLTGQIEIGGKRFVKCHFTDAILSYSGGASQLDQCTYTRVSFVMRGEALSAMRFLATMHQIGFADMVEMMFHRIRTNQLKDEPY